MLVLLVGPKGSGKTHVGCVLENRLGVAFFHVEPLWMAYHAACADEGRESSLDEGISRIHPRIAEALAATEHVCVETTAAAPEILDGLLTLQPRSRTLVVRLEAPLELCLERIASRDPTHQIPIETDAVRTVHARSVAAEVLADVTLRNVALSDDEIVAAIRPALGAGG